MFYVFKKLAIYTFGKKLFDPLCVELQHLLKFDNHFNLYFSALTLYNFLMK